VVLLHGVARPVQGVAHLGRVVVPALARAVEEHDDRELLGRIVVFRLVKPVQQHVAVRVLVLPGLEVLDLGRAGHVRGHEQREHRRHDERSEHDEFAHGNGGYPRHRCAFTYRRREAAT